MKSMTDQTDATGGKSGGGSTGQKVHAALHEMIMSMELAPNTELDEVQLSLDFGCSRTPIREALIRLASDDLVIMAPNRGARVAPLDIDRIPQILEALELYERVTIRWAALRRTPAQLALIRKRNDAFIEAVREGSVRRIVEANWAFHDAINMACGNQFVGADSSKMLRGIMRLSMLAFAQPEYPPNEDDDVGQHHGDMIAAIEAQDPDRAEAIVYDHSGGFRDRIRAFISGRSTADIKLGMRG